ncbi:MAG: prepilin-type N-terminal cleavage/methylation domain-containing protein [Coriobacteriales bacterium]|nr:prepilin-type N-terminal cleavage/methylation domain-containing protein [Coriobacteriales bacterium]
MKMGGDGCGQRGFTLVEMIVGLSISVVLIALAGSLIIFGMNFLNRTETRASDKHLAEQSADFVKQRLLYARSIAVIEADTPPVSAFGGELLFIGTADPVTGKISITNEGHLYYMRTGDTNPVDAFGAGSYDGNGLALSFRAIVDNPDAPADAQMRTSKTFEITAKTIRDGQVIYTSKKTFSLYEADPSNSVSPQQSMSIDSWNDDNSFEDREKHYYLLIKNLSIGYAQTGLIAQYDAIDNAVANGTPYHDPSASTWVNLCAPAYNPMQLYFTDGGGSVLENAIYFDGEDDYGKIIGLNLNEQNAVTLEIVFQPTNAGKNTMLYEYSPNWNDYSGSFGLAIFSNGHGPKPAENHTVERFGGAYDAPAAAAARNFLYAWPTDRFSTFSTVMVAGANDPLGRSVYVNGNLMPYQGEYPGTAASTAGTQTQTFGDYPLYIAARAGSSDFFQGMIASIRIYNRQLTPAEIKQNADEDYLRYGR